MSDPGPVPDVLDEAGRLRRLALSFVIAVVVAGLAFLICDRLAQPDDMAGGFDAGSQARAYRFVYYVTGLAFAVGFSSTLAILKAIARKHDREREFPRAKVR